ncbi:MAG: hypothetical protein Q9M22_06475, partial [Mariprofundaceae bacterium]|nr:hypothetical protein [Mariprofundaceae bacterium]
VKFQKAYVRTMESAIYQAKNEDDAQLVWLARLAIWAHTFDCIDQHLRDKVEHLKRLSIRGAQKRHNEAKMVAVQAESAWFTRHHERLRDYLLGLLLQQISTAEWGKVSKLSDAILDVMERDFIKVILDNPVLKANKPDDSWMLVQSYMLPPNIHGLSNRQSIALINQCLTSMFTNIEVADDQSILLKPDDLSSDAPAFFPLLEKGFIDLSWQDMAENITALFSPKGKAEMYGILRSLGNDEEKKRSQHENNMRLASQRLLLDTLKKEDLLPAIKASFKAIAGYQAISGVLTHRQVYEYYLGAIPQRAIRNKINSMGKVLGTKPDDLFKALDQVVDPDESGDSLAFRFLNTFVRYRHDLKTALLMRKHLLRIHVLAGDDDHRLSQANSVLYYFSSDEEDEDEDQGTIVGHVIIKADVRGSVGITQKLCDKGLNPATHFSRTFFDPISDLLDNYGAEKVFVEGDAIILSLMEYSNEKEHMAVARACGLSRDILRIVESNNEENKRNQLPVLELGIGVVYLTEAPAFLFDGDHKITISPAIGRSDRLSSCSKVVRPILEKAADHDPLRHNDVFAISEDGQSKNDKGEVHLRYNVDGIDLDPPAFMKLTKEISLKPVDIRLFGGKEKERYHLGRFKDNKGYLRFIAVRQGRVRLWNTAQAKRKVLPKAYYFEVVADQNRLSELESQLMPVGTKAVGIKR